MDDIEQVVEQIRRARVYYAKGLHYSWPNYLLTSAKLEEAIGVAKLRRMLEEESAKPQSYHEVKEIPFVDWYI